MNNTNKRIEELIEKVVKKATPGPWTEDDTHVFMKDARIPIGFSPFYFEGEVSGQEQPNADNDSVYIATFNPAFVLKLLESWKHMKDALEGTRPEEYQPLISESLIKAALAKADEVFE